MLIASRSPDKRHAIHSDGSAPHAGIAGGERGGRRRSARHRRIQGAGRLCRLLGVLVRALPAFVSLDEPHAARARVRTGWSSSPSTSITTYADAERFLDAHIPRFGIVFDPDGRLAERFGVRGLPTSFLIDRSGHIQCEARRISLERPRRPGAADSLIGSRALTFRHWRLGSCVSQTFTRFAILLGLVLGCMRLQRARRQALAARDPGQAGDGAQRRPDRCGHRRPHLLQ